MTLINLFKKSLLWVITATIPVVIAACYGVYYTVTGEVKDGDTKEPIEGIEVQCIMDEDDEYTIPEKFYSEIDGYFYIYNEDAEGLCDQVKFVDVDGELNGEYYEKTIDIDINIEEGEMPEHMIVELEPK